MSFFLKKRSENEWFLFSAEREETNLGHSKEERINWKWRLDDCFSSNYEKALWNQVRKCKKENSGCSLSAYSLLGSWSFLMGTFCELLFQSNGALGKWITNFLCWSLIHQRLREMWGWTITSVLGSLRRGLDKHARMDFIWSSKCIGMYIRNVDGYFYWQGDLQAQHGNQNKSVSKCWL